MALPQFTNKPETATGTAQEKVTIDSLAAGWEKRSAREALDEVARELGVRERLYVKWVDDSKHSISDATDRLQRLIKAASILQDAIDTGVVQ